jgi:MFS family permease
MSEHTSGAQRGSPVTVLSIVAGFVPWIVFSFVSTRLAADGVAWSALVAVAMTLIALVYGRRRHAPTMLNLYSLVLFGAMAVAGFVGGPDVDRWLYDWGRPLVGVVLGLLILAFTPFSPFTVEYARQTTPREYWGSPVFMKINRTVSAVWGVALVVTGAAAVLVTALGAHADGTDNPYLLDLLLNWVVPIAAIVAAVRFTATYPDRVTARSRPPDSRAS